MIAGVLWKEVPISRRVETLAGRVSVPDKGSSHRPAVCVNGAVRAGCLRVVTGSCGRWLPRKWCKPLELSGSL